MLGVSTDSHFSHLAWINSPRKQGGLGGLNYPLVSDFNKTISRDYGVLIEEAGIALRNIIIEIIFMERIAFMIKCLTGIHWSPLNTINLLYLVLIQNCFETAFFTYMMLISSLWMLLLPFFTWVSLSTAAWLIVCRLLLNYVCVGTSSKNICLHINNFSEEVSRDRDINCFQFFQWLVFMLKFLKICSIFLI